MAKKKAEKNSVAEMETQVRNLDKEIFQLRNELAMQRKLEKPHLIKEKRKQKARILTQLTKEKGAV